MAVHTLPQYGECSEEQSLVLHWGIVKKGRRTCQIAHKSYFLGKKFPLLASSSAVFSGIFFLRRWWPSSLSFLNVVTTHYIDNKTGKFSEYVFNKFKLEIGMVN